MKSKPIDLDEQDEHEVMLEIIKVIYNDMNMDIDLLPSYLKFHMFTILDRHYQYDKKNDKYKDK